MKALEVGSLAAIGVVAAALVEVDHLSGEPASPDVCGEMRVAP
jgi:hypothetical protein